MRNMYQTRRNAKLTQDALSHLTGIAQSNISALESGKYKPNQATREKIEEALGQQVDWIETGVVHLRESNYYQAERLLKRVVEMTLNMEKSQRDEFTQIVRKYFF